LITGASRGIGRAIALRLARDGHAVALNCRNKLGEAETLAREIRAAGGQALVVAADVAKPEQVDEMVRRTESDLGPIDILVNNAGLLCRADLAEFDVEQMEAMQHTNVYGLIVTTRSVAEGMRLRRYGRIVNIASNAGLGIAVPGATFYAATKAEVILLTRRFALEMGSDGITVNAVAPGYVVTDMVADGRTRVQLAERIREMGTKAMVGRVGQPEDIAYAVAFLASTEAGFITSQVLVVDGGRMDYIAHP
jgi:3-oxoacyl-[acyl-carrier protein] reductase